MSDGRLGLLDFGCVQRFTPEEMYICELGEQNMDGRMTIEETLFKGGYYSKSDLANEKYIAPLRRHMDWLTAPLLQEGPFDFGDHDFFKQGIDSLKEMVERVYPAAPMYLYFFRSPLRTSSPELSTEMSRRYWGAPKAGEEAMGAILTAARCVVLLFVLAVQNAPPAELGTIQGVVIRTGSTETISAQRLCWKEAPLISKHYSRY